MHHWTTFLIIFIFLYSVYFYYKRWALPPGPPTLPLIGSVPFLSSFGLRGLLDASLAKKYGKIYSVDLLSSCFIVINDLALAKNLFNRDDMSGRQSFSITSYVKGYNGTPHGIINNQGPSWQSQRRFSLMKLKNFGFGRKILESSIYKEVSYFFSIIEKEKNASGDLFVKDIFNTPVINVIWQIIASTRCDHYDENDKEIMEGVNDYIKSSYGIRSLFPVLFHLLPYSKIDRAILNLKHFLERIIDDHEKTLNECEPRDFIDSYLIEMRSGTDPHFSKKSLVVCCIDFFLAGSETSSTTLTWMLLYMALYQDVQEKCFEEINEVIGDMNPREEDMSTLPFSMATLNEIQRIGNTVPSSLIHVNTEEVTIEGYRIPKGTMFLANLRKFHLDPSSYENPEMLNPDRFYNVKNDPQFVPFGFGKRVCMGLSMAKKELYYFFVMILQAYKIEKSPFHDAPDPNNFDFGITACPKPFSIKMTKRNPY